MTRTRSIVTKSVAVAATVLLSAVGVSLGATAANATSASSVVTSVFSKINADRATDSSNHSDFLRNGFVDEYAQQVNAAEVASKGASDTVIPDPDVLQPDYTDVNELSFVLSGSLSSSSATKIAAAFDKSGIPFHEAYFNGNYAGISITSTKTKVYAEIVAVGYATPPLDRIVASTPTISGTPDVGATLTAKQTVTTPGTSTSYQWYADGDEPVGTDASTYVPDSDVFGLPVTVKTTVTESGFADIVLTSAATKDLGTGTLVGHTPVVSGSRNVGQTLNASTADWGPGDVTVDYVWVLNGKATDSVGSQYTIQPADKGKTINVEAVGSEAHFTTLKKSSSSSTKIGDPLLTSSRPTVTGTATVGQTLTAADAGGWGPGTVKDSWQWEINGKKISGATSSSYKITGSDYSTSGAGIEVVETGTESGYAATSQTSLLVGIISEGSFEVTGSPSYSGTAEVGKTIKAVLPTYSPTPTTIKYTWTFNGTVLSTSSSYKIATSLAGDTITLNVAASKTGYTTSHTQDDTITITGAP